MDDLIEAFTIFRKYSDAKYPTNCSRNELYVNVDPDRVSSEDLLRLDALGFIVDEEYEQGFKSYRFGSC